MIKQIILFVVIITFFGVAQDTTKSLAFKNNKRYRNAPYFYQPDLSYQLLQQFKLIQEANSGDPLAQHELGMRLLIGEGLPADTAQAVYWIHKAASQELTSAVYNYAILLINGWGVEWNPFEAFKNFRKAAFDGMPQAQYVTGLLYTDNLVVTRNYEQAYYWIKKSHDNGYENAVEVLESLKDVVDEENIQISNDVDEKIKDNGLPSNDFIQPSTGLVFIDFDAIIDTVREISDSLLVKDLKNSGISNIIDSLNIKFTSDLSNLTENQLSKLISLSEIGVPEAMTILGRYYESDKSNSSNIFLAAEYYIRAIRLDSPRSPFLLLKLIKTENFFTNLKSSSDKNNPSAQFVWYGLNSLSYDNRITEFDAANFLQNSANQNHIPAILELGYNHYTGKYFKESKLNGISLWQIGEKYGSVEASVRIAASRVFDKFGLLNPEKLFEFLDNSAEKGSLLATVALASAYEEGIGVKRSTANAVSNYRSAAHRGSQFAYLQLKRIYNSLRPAEKEFVVD